MQALRSALQNSDHPVTDVRVRGDCVVVRFRTPVGESKACDVLREAGVAEAHSLVPA